MLPHRSDPPNTHCVAYARPGSPILPTHAYAREGESTSDLGVGSRPRASPSRTGSASRRPRAPPGSESSGAAGGAAGVRGLMMASARERAVPVNRVPNCTRKASTPTGSSRQKQAARSGGTSMTVGRGRSGLGAERVYKRLSIDGRQGSDSYNFGLLSCSNSNSTTVTLRTKEVTLTGIHEAPLQVEFSRRTWQPVDCGDSPSRSPGI